MNLKPEFVGRAEELLGGDVVNYLSFLSKPLVPSFRVNTLKVSVKELRSRLEGQGWVLRKVPWCAEGFWVDSGPRKLGSTLEHFLGYYYLQEPASMIPPLLMDLSSGLRVLDMAASPGSKTGEIAALMGDEGLIIANDVRIDRVSILKFNLQRVGVRSVVITRRNAVNFNRLPGFFDRVLLDAPCSGEGVIRKNPFAMVQWNHRNFSRFARVQRSLILSAFDSLRVGGVLVYSTCSLAPEENEAVVDFLVRNRDGVVVEPVKLSGLVSRSGVVEWRGRVFDGSLVNSLRVYPHDNDTIGFFVAKIRKVGDGK